MDDIEKRQCGRKVMYPDIERARLAVKTMHKRHKAQFSAYHCNWCHYFHVGTLRSTAAAERREKRRSA